jgi:translation initiation factor IF-3
MFKKRKPSCIKKPPVNDRIRAREVRLINEKKEQLGVISISEALKIAKEQGMDLIQVTKKVQPPVCKLGDYGKYLYLEEKKERSVRKNKGGELKGIRLTYNISLHDMETKAKLAEKFLKKGDRVKIELLLRGRQKALGGFAKEKMGKFIETLKGRISIKTEKELKREPRGFTMIVSKIELPKEPKVEK